MTRILPILFALIIGFQPLGEAFFYLWYVVDNSSFTRTFCINQEKSDLQCNGKCHLMAISPVQTENTSPAAPPVVIPKPNSPDTALPPETLIRNSYSCLTTIEQPDFHPDWRETLLVQSIFQPPEWGGNA